MVREHVLDGKIIDPKRAVPRRDDSLQEKLFVRNIPPGVNQESFRIFFSKFGSIHDSTLMMDRETGIHRGFGFISYSSPNTVEKVLASQPVVMNGQVLEVKKSTPRPRRDGRDNAPIALGPDQNQTNHYPAQSPIGGGAFDPKAMAAMFKNFQGGANMWQGWNPMMLMQAMQGGGNMMTGFGGMGIPNSNHTNPRVAIIPHQPPPPNAPKGPAAMRDGPGPGPARTPRGAGRGHPYARPSRWDNRDSQQ